MTACTSDIGNIQDRARSQSLLYASAVLVANRRLVVVGVDSGDAQRQNRQSSGGNDIAGLNVEPRIGERNAVECRVQVARRIDSTVVHVVTLNALVHDAESTADDG